MAGAIFGRGTCRRDPEAAYASATHLTNPGPRLPAYPRRAWESDVRDLRIPPISSTGLKLATDHDQPGQRPPVPTTPLFFFSVFVSACSAFSAVKSLGFRCLPLNV